MLGFIHSPENKPRLSIIVDASGSMSYSDAPNQPNRYRQAAIAVQNTLVPRLEKNFDIQVFAYDGKHSAALKGSDELDQVPPNGDATDLGAAIALGSNNAAQQAILFSDGIHNGPVTVAAELSTVTIPVNTVRVGSSEVEPSSVPDIAVISVEGPQTSTVNNQVTLTASIKSTGAKRSHDQGDAGQSGGCWRGSRARWMNSGWFWRSGPTPQTVQLKFTPDKVGRVVVRVAVPVDPDERSDVNNQQDFALLVTDPKLSVLYVEGRVRPEVGPLRRTLEQDPNVNAVSMVQTQAGKFDLRGAKEGDDLKGLPTTLAQWKRFKVIILGDLDASFLNSRQQKDLEQVVREGAGLLMIGGQNSFAPGGWDKTTLATLLPVSLAPVQPPQINTKFVPQLTAAGTVHPIFRNITSYFLNPEGKTQPQQMPDLSGCVALAGAKPGAVVLAVHPTEKIAGAPAIVLAVQQYGQGRTAAFAADTTWHLESFPAAGLEKIAVQPVLAQMVRWLARRSEDLGRKIRAQRDGDAGEGTLRYEAGEPLRDVAGGGDGYAGAGDELCFGRGAHDVTGPDGKTGACAAGRTDAEEGAWIGMYEAVHQPKMSGAHKVVFGRDEGRRRSGEGRDFLFWCFPRRAKRMRWRRSRRRCSKSAGRRGELCGAWSGGFAGGSARRRTAAIGDGE